MKRGLGYLSKHETFIFIGMATAVGTLGKLLGLYDISSDWFWFVAGIGLIIEGSISLLKQQRFEKKYRVIEVGSQEYELLHKANLGSNKL